MLFEKQIRSKTVVLTMEQLVEHELCAGGVGGGQEQCDQIGLLLKTLGNRFSFKNSPNTWELFGLFYNFHLMSQKLLSPILGQFLDKIGLLFISTSGHTGREEGLLCACY